MPKIYVRNNKMLEAFSNHPQWKDYTFVNMNIKDPSLGKTIDISG